VTASVLTRQLALAATPATAVVVPAWIAHRANVAGWTTCDVCSWPVDAAAVVAGRRPRHPGCVCPICDAPLAGAQPGVLFHPPCDPDAVLLRSARRGRLVLVAGGGS